MIDKQVECQGPCCPDGIAQIEPYDNGGGLARLSELLRVISDERRLRILAALTQQEMCVCDLMTRLDMGQSLVSHHLAVLKQAGLVRDRRDAQWVYYSVDPQHLADLKARFLGVLDVANLTPEAAYGASPRVC